MEVQGAFVKPRNEGRRAQARAVRLGRSDIFHFYPLWLCIETSQKATIAPCPVHRAVSELAYLVSESISDTIVGRYGLGRRCDATNLIALGPALNLPLLRIETVFLR
jgi:hypothetical protein